mgnify:CR=1 FL=1
MAYVKYGSQECFVDTDLKGWQDLLVHGLCALCEVKLYVKCLLSRNRLIRFLDCMMCLASSLLTKVHAENQSARRRCSIYSLYPHRLARFLPCVVVIDLIFLILELRN